MSKAKIAISLNEQTLADIDRLVARRIYPNRSRAVEAALQEKIERLNHTRLARECALLDMAEEKALAEEGLGEDLAAWPEY